MNLATKTTTKKNFKQEKLDCSLRVTYLQYHGTGTWYATVVCRNPLLYLYLCQTLLSGQCTPDSISHSHSHVRSRPSLLWIKTNQNSLSKLTIRQATSYTNYVFDTGTSKHTKGEKWVRVNHKQMGENSDEQWWAKMSCCGHEWMTMRINAGKARASQPVQWGLGGLASTNARVWARMWEDKHKWGWWAWTWGSGGWWVTNRGQ